MVTLLQCGVREQTLLCRKRSSNRSRATTKYQQYRRRAMTRKFRPPLPLRCGVVFRKLKAPVCQPALQVGLGNGVITTPDRKKYNATIQQDMFLLWVFWHPLFLHGGNRTSPHPGEKYHPGHDRPPAQKAPQYTGGNGSYGKANTITIPTTGRSPPSRYCNFLPDLWI